MNKPALIVKIKHSVFEDFSKSHTLFIYWQNCTTHNETEFIIIYSDYPEENEDILKKHFENIKTCIIRNCPVCHEKIVEAYNSII